jgi:glutamyl-tRNA reductase
MNRLLLIGLNHVTAPLAVRERLAFDPVQQPAALEKFKQRFAGCEAVLLSTCNRIELYVASAHRPLPSLDAILQFIGESHGVAPMEFRAHAYEKTERSAIEHVFNVAASLDSMVLGEHQILGQVRQAYELSRQFELAGSVLHPLFQRAIAVGKEVLAQTALGEGRLSVASVAVAYARKIFETFGDKTVLCIGAGKMSELVLQHFAALRPRRLMVCNRDATKAGGLAARFKAEPLEFEALEQHLASADIIITSTAAPHPIITTSQIERALKHRRYRAMFIIDIAVPRDIEAAVGDNEHVYLYNVDDLQSVVSATQAQRSDAVNAARQVVARHVDDFLTHQRQRANGPAIHQLYQRSHALARQELERALARLPNLTEADRAELQELTRRIVNKLLHDPIATMRDSTHNDPSADDAHRNDPPTSAA